MQIANTHILILALRKFTCAEYNLFAAENSNFREF